MTHIKWNTKPTIYVDIETGEIIDKIKKGYIAIKTERKTKLNGNKTIGTIQYTIQCRRHPQLEIGYK